MKIICHRANLFGPSEYENSIKQAHKCIEYGFDVELDLRFIGNKLFLGHDSPESEIDLNNILEMKSNLWIHCKDVQSLEYFSNTDFNYFWHDTDKYTLTSKNIGWVFPNCAPYKKSVVVLPEICDYRIDEHEVYGLCTDYPFRYKK